MKEFSIDHLKVRTLIDASLPDGTFEAFEFIIDKEDVGPNLHLHRLMDEVLYLVSGSVEASFGKEKHILKPGDRIMFPRNVPHIWRTLGPSKLLVIFSPSKRQADFFSRLESAIKQKVSWDEAVYNLSKEFDVVPI